MLLDPLERCRRRKIERAQQIGVYEIARRLRAAALAVTKAESCVGDHIDALRKLLP